LAGRRVATPEIRRNVGVSAAPLSRRGQMQACTHRRIKIDGRNKGEGTREREHEGKEKEKLEERHGIKGVTSGSL
jgi:hypothetical protein